MTLDELRGLVGATTADDWSELKPGPVHIYSWGDGREDGEWRLFLDGHHSRAVLKQDLDVGLAWGLTWNEDFEGEVWAKHFANPSASGHYADIFWRGVPVSREQYVTVDGGRYVIPLPRQDFEHIKGDNYALMPYTISPWQYAFGRIIQNMNPGFDYDDGLSRARIEVAD
jgi:hypothetical protein